MATAENKENAMNTRKNTPKSHDLRTRIFLGMDPQGRPRWGRCVIRPKGLKKRIAKCRRGEMRPRDLIEVQTIGDLEISEIIGSLMNADDA